LGERGERRQWREERPERSAAVEKIEEKRKPDDFFGHRKPGCRTDFRKPFGQAHQVLPPQPTMRTENDIGLKNHETAAVSGFGYNIFQSELKSYIASAA